MEIDRRISDLQDAEAHMPALKYFEDAEFLRKKQILMKKSLETRTSDYQLLIPNCFLSDAKNKKPVNRLNCENDFSKFPNHVFQLEGGKPVSTASFELRRLSKLLNNYVRQDPKLGKDESLEKIAKDFGVLDAFTYPNVSTPTTMFAYCSLKVELALYFNLAKFSSELSSKKQLFTTTPTTTPEQSIRRSGPFASRKAFAKASRRAPKKPLGPSNGIGPSIADMPASSADKMYIPKKPSSRENEKGTETIVGGRNRRRRSSMMHQKHPGPLLPGHSFVHGGPEMGFSSDGGPAPMMMVAPPHTFYTMQGMPQGGFPHVFHHAAGQVGPPAFFRQQILVPPADFLESQDEDRVSEHGPDNLDSS
eukprot:GHVP01040445.1.p1 GENE.GHVP01040445.1~~GHVP01040445.1.p1  ORF type:complete len:363 (-),score=69.03 GHVP01040445.1:1463-2551(-)